MFLPTIISITTSSILLLQSLPITTADEPPVLNFDGLGGSKPCPNFRCAGGKKPVQKERTKFSSKGCSAMSSGSITMNPGQDSDEIYSSCCDLWHSCYQVCGAAKAVCDDGFKKCAEELCGGDTGCKSSADMKMLLIGFGGCQQYDQAQYQACECVSKNDVEKRKTKALRYFYKKVAPDAVNKAEQLGKKADTAAKMAGLFLKLLKKYPNAIKKVKDPQIEMYEQMMKNVRDKSSTEEDLSDDVDEGDSFADSDETQEL